MRKVALICFAILFALTTFIGCSNESKETNSNNGNVIKKEDKSSEKVIYEYFECMKSNDIKKMKTLFKDNLENLPDDFTLDYVKDVKINKIEKPDYNSEEIKRYLDYIEKNYSIKRKDIEIYSVTFDLYANEGHEDLEEMGQNQKFALAKDNGKWIICEMFR